MGKGNQALKIRIIYQEKTNNLAFWFNNPG
jgi:hypothetical protein